MIYFLLSTLPLAPFLHFNFTFPPFSLGECFLFAFYFFTFFTFQFHIYGGAALGLAWFIFCCQPSRSLFTFLFNIFTFFIRGVFFVLLYITLLHFSLVFSSYMAVLDSAGHDLLSAVDPAYCSLLHFYISFLPSLYLVIFSLFLVAFYTFKFSFF